jgi:hypothetical protein
MGLGAGFAIVDQVFMILHLGVILNLGSGSGSGLSSSFGARLLFWILVVVVVFVDRIFF